MSDDLLQRIQQMQFNNRSEAEALLLAFIQETFPQLEITDVSLRPQAVSLNSFNGFLSLADGSRLFYKTHVEQDNTVSEYYNAAMLADAGYPVVQPLYASTRYGQQIVVYEVVEDPSVFDVARRLETAAEIDQDELDTLTRAQHKADMDLYNLYLASYRDQSAAEAAQAPVHQLFYHRLAGGRLDRFYGPGTRIQLPDGEHDLATVRTARWHINGSDYPDTIDDIIDRALRLLHPAQAGPSVVGHGDAHNGNVFFSQQTAELRYFDPAFAGRHHPLLDLTKPLFHNVFAMWMYFPEEETDLLQLSLSKSGNLWSVQHNFDLNVVRHMFLSSKYSNVLVEIIQYLKEKQTLREDWRAYLKCALFCCPFLTLDLKRFPPSISLLGLAFAVQMGSESAGKRSIMDQLLDEIEG